MRHADGPWGRWVLGLSQGTQAHPVWSCTLLHARLHARLRRDGPETTGRGEVWGNYSTACWGWALGELAWAMAALLRAFR